MPVVILNHCSSCGACVASCQPGALSLEPTDNDGCGRKKAVVSFALCLSCGACILACRLNAIEFASGLSKSKS